jgi:hypothetical protein
MNYRIVKSAGGIGRIQLIHKKCQFVLRFGEMCLEPVRLSHGAVFCESHRHLENAGCSGHDRLKCKECRE